MIKFSLQNVRFTVTYTNIKKENQDSSTVKYVIKYLDQNMIKEITEKHMNQKSNEKNLNRNFNAHFVVEGNV